MLTQREGWDWEQAETGEKTETGGNMRQLDMLKAGSGSELRQNEGLKKEQAVIKSRLRQGEVWEQGN